MLNPTNLATETMFQGFHDRDDPGTILYVQFNTMNSLGWVISRDFVGGFSLFDEYCFFWWK